MLRTWVIGFAAKIVDHCVVLEAQKNMPQTLFNKQAFAIFNRQLHCIPLAKSRGPYSNVNNNIPN
jgi:hypothetical protein